MTVVNTKSTLITNAEATPIVPVSPVEGGGWLNAIAASIEVAAADDDTSVYRFFRIHSSWRVHTVLLLNDAITSGTSYDFGLYTIGGGAVVDADFFASAVDLSSGRVAPLDITHEAMNIDAGAKPVWQQRGLSSDPDLWYDVAATANTVGSAAGTITLKLTYVKN